MILIIRQAKTAQEVTDNPVPAVQLLLLLPLFQAELLASTSHTEADVASDGQIYASKSGLLRRLVGAVRAHQEVGGTLKENLEKEYEIWT